MSRLWIAIGSLALLGLLAVGFFLGPWDLEDWWSGQTAPALSETTTVPPEVQSPRPPPMLLDRALEPYRVLLKAIDLVEAKDYGGALALLTAPPPEGYQLFLFHTLRARHCRV